MQMRKSSFDLLDQLDWSDYGGKSSWFGLILKKKTLELIENSVRLSHQNEHSIVKKNINDIVLSKSLSAAGTGQ